VADCPNSLADGTSDHGDGAHVSGTAGGGGLPGRGGLAAAPQPEAAMVKCVQLTDSVFS
jgi:hypothetical protein